ncbi:MAG: AMP-binding protein, partial [Deltaproteobacteria bacterium]|nr:AMP-binding protein [Deltaproteobacteria bacterium]
MAKAADLIRVAPDVLVSFGRLTLPQVLADQARRMDPSRVAIREKAYGIWKTYNWQTYLDYVRQTALGLVSLGLRRGENIGIVTNNHPEWLFSEVGGQSAGAVTMNLFTSSAPEELATALSRIRATIVIVQDQEQVDKLLEMKARLGHIRQVIYVDPTGMRRYVNDPWLISYSELLDRGRRLDLEEPERFSRELARGKAGDVALMIQTSGTTGIPKLAMLSHRSFTEMARQWLETAPIGIGSNWISVTPPAWIVDQMWGVGITLAGGMTMNFPETLETVDEDFREIGPSVIITSSRFWEDLASKIRVKMDDAGWVKKKIF